VNRTLTLAVLTLALSAAPSLAAAETTWSVDPGHSNAEFTVRHFVITNVKGTIPITAATIVTATGSTTPLSISATLDPGKLDSKNENRDSDLRGPDFFDTAKFSTISFKSTKIVPGTGGEFAVTGDLTIHGITKSVTMEAKMLGTMTDGRGRQRAGYEATLKIDRRDFGMTKMSGSGANLVAATDVFITLEIEAIAR
jgi:polyisoprenoid-binding protein YceI